MTDHSTEPQARPGHERQGLTRGRAAAVITLMAVGAAIGLNDRDDAQPDAQPARTEVTTPSPSTSEADEPTYQVAAERMRERHVNESITFIKASVSIDHDAKLYSAPSEEAEPVVLRGEGETADILVANPDLYKETLDSDEPWICFQTGDGELVCSNDFAKMKIFNPVDGSEKPLVPGEIEFEVRRIEFVDDKGLAYIEDLGDGQNMTDHGVRVGQQVDSFMSLGEPTTPLTR